MKALTLYQPWAKLIALGEKTIETRSWATNYRGQLAIHAGTNKVYIKMHGKQYICGQEPFRTTLNSAIRNHAKRIPTGSSFMPLGAVLAVCNLVDCLKIENDGLYRVTEASSEVDLLLFQAPLPGEPERSFGNYTPGRFAWILEDVQPLPKPIPAKGKQGLWNWEPPADFVI